MKWRFLCSVALVVMGCGEDISQESVQGPTETMNDDSRSQPGDTIQDPVTMPSPSPSAEWVPPMGERVGVSSEEGTAVDVRYPEGDEAIIVPRPRRRMNIDQLRSAMEQVSGGISWTEGSGRNEENLFETLSSTLGKPDYAQTTDEELEPTVLFQKFLGDAARSICFKMLDADVEAQTRDSENVEESVEWTPTLLLHVPVEDGAEVDQESVVANVQWLVQRFHGRRLDADAGGLSEWIWLYQTGTFVSSSSHQAWTAVCVGLFTHPDFYMY